MSGRRTTFETTSSPDSSLQTQTRLKSDHRSGVEVFRGTKGTRLLGNTMSFLKDPPSSRDGKSRDGLRRPGVSCLVQSRWVYGT